MRPAALLLDLDGTLVDSEPLQREGYRRFFDARGWPAPDLSVFTGRRAADVFPILPGPWQGHDPVPLSQEVVGLVPRGVPPDEVPGAGDLVRAAAALGVRVAIVTSAGPGWVQTAVGDGLDVLDLVELVVTGQDVVDGKPHPAGFLLACERLAVDPGDTWAVEDSVAGIAAAVAAGVGTVIGVTTSASASQLADAGAQATHADLRPVARRLTD